MRRFLAVAVAAVFGLGCVAASGGVAPSSSKEQVLSRPRLNGAAATPSPVAPDGALAADPAAEQAASRRRGLIAALHNGVAASRAAAITRTLGEATRLISDKGGGIISNNGGTIISNNGGSYRVAQAPEVFKVETDVLVYVIRVETEQTGEFKTYDRGRYEALGEAEREQALLDHFTWDHVAILTGQGENKDLVAVAYTLHRVSSKRIPFAETLVSKELYRVEQQESGFAGASVGWEIEFSMDVPLLGEARDRASFKAVAGEKDLKVVTADNGYTVTLPMTLALTGTNTTGAYVGRIEHDAEVATRVTHTATAGAKTHVALQYLATGGVVQDVESVEAGLRVVARIVPGEAGVGEVLDAKGERAGEVRWDAEGIATITFEDGAVERARLF